MVPAILIVALTALVMWPLVFVNPEYLVQGSSADELYHFPAIEKFAAELPTPDYSNYSSATTPGYHTVLAIPRAAGVGYQGIRLMASLWTLALVGVLAWVVGKRFGFGGDVLVLPIIATNYVLFPGMWLLPDNAGWFGVLLILLLCLRDRPTWKTHALAGLILVVLVFFRQVHIWIAAVIWLSAWIGSSEQVPPLAKIFEKTSTRIQRTLIAAAWTIPAFALIVYFVQLWGGLVPPAFGSEHNGYNPATPGFVLLQASVLSLFFAPVVIPRFIELLKTQRGWIFGAVVVGIVCGIGPESAYSLSDGRYGGWWNLIEKFPAIFDRSPIYMIGSVVGAVAIVVWGSMLSRRDAWIIGWTLVVFVLSQTVNLRAWQRYHEPMLLMMLVLIAARAHEMGACRKRLIFGSAALATMLAAITWLQITEQVPRGITDPRVESLQKSADSVILPD